VETLSITKVGLLDLTNPLHRKFDDKYLDYKREEESAVVYELFKMGNRALAVLHASNTIDRFINEQMHLKRFK
jgi:hypothetical protein